MTRKELLNELKLSTYVALDFETTGLDPKVDRIIEVAAIRFVDGEPTKRFSTLVNPKAHISSFITKITGISNDMVASAPKEEEIVSEWIPKSLKSQFFKGILVSYASEHGARMTAMHKATDNAGELKRELTLTYNKARQAAITGEILEIVGGAEALQS